MSKSVFELPHASTVDGITLQTSLFPVVFQERLDDTRLRENDVVLATYPRTGTTWLSQVVSLMLVDESKYDQAKALRVQARVLFLEVTRSGNKEPEIRKLDTIPSPRAVKTHLPFRLINRWLEEDKVKTIVTTRNPKDTLVSLFHFYQDCDVFGFDGTWGEFFEHIQTGRQLNGDQYEWFLDWNNHKDKGDIMFIKYEDMKKDLFLEIKKISEFLGVTISESRMKRIMQDADIKAMKNSESSKISSLRKEGHFIRKGKTGEWKNYFTVAQNEWFDNKYKEQYKKLDIDVDYE